MRKSRFSETQIVAILKEGEAGVPVAESFGTGSAGNLLRVRRRYRATVPDLKRLREAGGETRSLSGCTRTSRRNAAIRSC